MILPRAVMTRCGSGLTAPFAIIRFTASVEDDFAVLSQYEGRLLFDIMKLPYEEMTYWFYVIELTENSSPSGRKTTAPMTPFSRQALWEEKETAFLSAS